MTTLDRLDQIEARARAATEGPWDYRESSRAWRCWSVWGVRPDESIGDGEVHVGDVRGEVSEGDAEFIAAARTDVPALVAAVRAVLDKHQPLDAIHTVTGKSLQVCSGCGRDRDWMPWPCPTVQAVTDALGGERA